MARLWIVCLLLISCILLTTSFPTEQKNIEEETPQPQVEFGKLLPKIIGYLQEDPNRIYFYKDFLVFDVKKKEDSIDVQLQVKIICIKEEQCADTAYLICNATLPQNGNTYIFDGSVNCDPVVIKTDLSTSTAVPLIVIEPLSSEQQKHDTLELSHEITSQISGEQFIATPSQDPTHLTVPLHCTGCLEPVNPSAEGVDELVHSALKHLLYDRKAKHELIRVVKVERQIVAGVKYSILVEVKEVGEGCNDGAKDKVMMMMEECRETSDDSSKYCKIDFISMPWVNKLKRIISNNCTATQTYPLLESPNNSDDMDNEIDVNHPYKTRENNDKKPEKPNYDKMAESGSLDEESETLMTPERIAFLESQIIMEQFTPETRTTEEIPKVQQTTVDNTQMAVDDIPSIFMMDEPGAKLSNDEIVVTQEIAQDIKVAKRQSKIPVDEKTPDTAKSTSSSEEETAGRQTAKQDSSEESSEETQAQKFIPHSKNKRSLRIYDYQSLNCPHLLQEITPVASSSNTNPVFKLSSKLESQIVEAIHKFAANKNEFGLIEDLQSFSQEQPLLFNVFVSVFRCVTSGDFEAYPRLECTPDWSEKIRADLVTVAAADNEVSVVATYDLGTCLQTFPLLPVTYIQSPSAWGHSRKPRGIPGGLNSLPVDDDRVLSFVRSTLTQLDAGSAHDTKYKMLEVIEASSQVVAGALYRIKVKIAPSDCLKSKDVDPQNCGDLKEAVPIICTLKIWDRPWLPNGRETNITCTEAGKNSRPQIHHFRSKREISHESDYQLLLQNIYQMQMKHISNHLRFTQFQVMYNRKYTDATETAKKARIFVRNMEIVKRNLRSYKEDYATYGPSKFADIEPEEFKRTYLGLKPRSAHPNSIPLPMASIPKLASIPDAVDWRAEGMVTPVKNQGACGSCWAFSVTGNIEGQYAMKHNKLLEFSEQELVDCDKTDNGCGGGYMTDAYIAIEKLGGLETEDDYPYDAQDEQCHFNQSLVKVHVVNAVNISQDEGEMAQWLVKNGPISIGINANAMQFYMGGVSHPWKMMCDPGNLDHGVLIVGYGVSKNTFFNKTKPFWTVKNSWGKNWGEQGYYRVYRGDGTCGVNMMASSAMVD